jgi:hypothetical protein
MPLLARTSRFVALMSIAALSACSTTTPEAVGASVDRATWSMRRETGLYYLILIVDDTDTPSGAAVRKDVIDDFRASAARYATPTDAWTPANFRVVVVRPSAVEVHPIVAGASDSRLTWSQDNASAGSGEAMAAAIENALSTLQPDPSSSYRPIEAAADIAALVSSPPTRRPRSPDEEAVFHDAADGAIGQIRVFLASARDDASPLPVASYGRVPNARISLVEPAASDCVPSPATRLAEWARDGDVRATEGFPCSMPRMGDALAPTYFADSECIPDRVTADSRGLAECLVTATTADPGACSKERGWLDPVGSDGSRRPTFDGTRRVCEVSQFAGEALQRCRSGRPCDGFGSGWCLVEPPFTGSSCTDSIRGIGGALTGSALFSFACDLHAP